MKKREEPFQEYKEVSVPFGILNATSVDPFDSMDGLKYVKTLASMLLMIPALILIGTITYVAFKLRHFLNILIEGSDQTSGYVLFFSSGMFLMVLMAVAILFLALIGFVRVAGDYKVMLKPNIAMATVLILYVASFSLTLQFSNEEDLVITLQQSMKKYSNIKSVTEGWDDIQTQVRDISRRFWVSIRVPICSFAVPLLRGQQLQGLGQCHQRLS